MRTPTRTASKNPRIEIDRKRLVSDNLAYVRAIAARIKEQLPRELEFDDLVAYGTQGLMEAAERFDGKFGASFTTYSYYRIRGAIFDGLRGMGWLPRSEYARARFEERAAAYLANLADREAGAQEYGNVGPTLEEDVRELSQALGGVATVFVTSLRQEEEESVEDTAPQAHEQLEQHEARSSLRATLEGLPEKERRLIELYYFEEKTLEEAGTALGLSKSWASRLHARAVDLLKATLQRCAPGALDRTVRRRRRDSR